LLHRGLLPAIARRVLNAGGGVRPIARPPSACCRWLPCDLPPPSLPQVALERSVKDPVTTAAVGPLVLGLLRSNGALFPAVPGGRWQHPPPGDSYSGNPPLEKELKQQAAELKLDRINGPTAAVVTGPLHSDPRRGHCSGCQIIQQRCRQRGNILVTLRQLEQD
jgi:hypothetical protein